MMILDTDIVTLLTYGQTKKLKERIEAVDESEELAVTVITYMEILGPRYDSIYKAASVAQMTKAAAGFRSSKVVLDGFLLLHHDDDSCRRFEEMMKKKGKKKDRADMMIASIALANGAVLVTRNVKDYKGVAGLRVENWAD